MITCDNAAAVLLDLRSISKSYAGPLVLDSVNLALRAGEVHALLGQNGSGKSTLITILAGVTIPEPGATAVIDGEDARLGALTTAQRRRLHFIHQDDNLVPALSVLDNLALGNGYPTRFGRIKWAEHIRRSRELLRDLGTELDPERRAESLSIVEQMTVAIARAMSHWTTSRSILVLDEPTTKLPAPDVDRLFKVIGQVTAAGAAVLFVSHRLDEVLRIADRVTVLRDGRVVASQVTDQLAAQDLIEAMVGRPFDVQLRAAARQPGQLTCRVRGLRTERLDGLSFDVHEGEILGVAGLDGSGRECVAEAVFGATPRSDGEVEIRGRPTPPLPHAAIAAGMALVPAGRAQRGCHPKMTVRENASLIALRRFANRWTIVNSGSERDAVLAQMQSVSLHPLKPEWAVHRYSGGNQQKIVFGKCLLTHPRLLILDEPAQGVDVQAKAALFALIADAAASGMAVLITSAVVEDLAGLCSRILTMRDGRLVEEISMRGRLPVEIAAEVMRSINSVQTKFPSPAH